MFLVALLTALPAVARAQQQFAELGDFKLESGEVIRNCRVGYRTFGKLNRDRSNAVLFLTWYSGPSEYLAGMFGPRRMVNGDFYGIAIDALGNGISSSPSNSAAQPRMKFPRFTIRDMVRTQHQVVTQVLQLKHLRAVAGVSMGGMQALQWAVSYPDFMDKVVTIHASPRLGAYELMLWQAHSEAIMRDPAWNGGDYKQQPSARLVAMIDALTDTAPQRFNRENTRETWSASIDGAARKIEKNDANDRIRQAQAMTAHDVSAAFGGSLERAAAAMKAKLLAVVTAGDHIVPPGAMLEFARLKRAQVLQLENECGHSGANCEYNRVKDTVNEFLER